MDNSEFDHIIKDKLESLNPSYNESAWEALHYRLDLLAPLPWYSRWKSYLIAGSLALITLINVGVLLKVNENHSEVKQLLDELSENGSSSHRVDTIYLASADNYLGSSLLSNATASQRMYRGATPLVDRQNSLFDPFAVYKITGNSQKGSPSPGQRITATFRAQTGVAAQPVDASKDLMLTLDGKITAISALDPFDQHYKLNAPQGEDMFVRGIVIPPSKKKWDHPLDLRLGVATGYLVPDPDLGERFVSSRQGIYVETPLRGNFHALSGLAFHELIYKLDDVDDNNFEQRALLRYPDFGSFPTTPDEIRVENRVLQVPVYARFYKSLNNNWSVFAGAGPTLDLLLDQKFVYSFLEIQNEQLVEFEEVRRSRDVKLTVGSMSGNFGIEHYFSRRLSAQMELNYQYGLGKMGLEKRSFNSLSISGGLFYKLNTNKGR